ncbi:hypothetical protein EK904_006085 [Melospiza melodia maxima]|nr:hypothetical protein EK904_006085 [Melospiza melodia maxima]
MKCNCSNLIKEMIRPHVCAQPATLPEQFLLLSVLHTPSQPRQEERVSVPTLRTFLTIPRPLAEPDYPSQASFFTSLVHFETVPLSRRTPPLPFLPSTQFSQDISRTEPRVFTYLLQK